MNPGRQIREGELLTLWEEKEKNWLCLEETEVLAIDLDLTDGTGVCALGKGRRGILNKTMLEIGEWKDMQDMVPTLYELSIEQGK